MSKTTNKKQFDLLLNAMQLHPDIARGFFRGSKEELSKFWQNLEIELNSAGPPSKNTSEWKKVWADQKKYVRQKAAQNLKNTKATGGGPNAEHIFSANEETIYALLNMKESIEGVATSFGLSRTQEAEGVSFTGNKENSDVRSPNVFSFMEEASYEPPTKKGKTKDQSCVKRSTSDVLAEELEVQQKTLKVLEEQQHNLRKLYRSTTEIANLAKEHLKLRIEEIEEQKRHNAVMEHFRAEELQHKIEKTKRLLEIEDLKRKL